MVSGVRNSTFCFAAVGSNVLDVKTMNRELNLQNCTVVQLRNVLRSLGLSTKGRKAELVRVLLALNELRALDL